MSEITNTRNRSPQNTISTKKTQLHLSLLFYTEHLVGLILPKNMFKMFPQISGLKNIALVKGWHWDLVITIEDVLFNLDQSWWILIQLTNILVNFDKYNQSHAKYWIQYITREHYNYTRRSWVNHWTNGSQVTNYLFMSFQWFIHLYCLEIFISIIKTH